MASRNHKVAGTCQRPAILTLPDVEAELDALEATCTRRGHQSVMTPVQEAILRGVMERNMPLTTAIPLLKRTGWKLVSYCTIARHAARLRAQMEGGGA